MTFLFSKTGLTDLRKRLKPKILLAFDYDGVLAPIVVKPQQAKIPLSTARLLKKLSTLADVAIVSGRGRQALLRLMPFRIKYVIGNHGLEGVAKGAELKTAAKINREWFRQLTKMRWPTGMYLENKKYSLSLHYRQTANPSHAKLQIKKALLNLKPRPALLDGKRVWNVLPPSSPDKGTAIEHLLKTEKYHTVFFIGDDHTDETVFRLKNRKIFSVRVGTARKTRAPYFIRTRSEIDRVLAELNKICQ